MLVLNVGEDVLIKWYAVISTYLGGIRVLVHVSLDCFEIWGSEFINKILFHKK